MSLDKGTIAYLQALKGCGVRGFTPIGQLYASILYDLCNQGLATSNGRGTFYLSEFGASMLEKESDAASV